MCLEQQRNDRGQYPSGTAQLNVSRVPPPARIVLVEQYFYPDGWGGAEIPRDLAIALSSAALAVDVLCGTEQYAPLPPGAAPINPADHGVRIVRLPRLLGGSVRRLRTLRVVLFCLCALPVLLLRRHAALFMTQTNPPLIVPTVALVAALRRRPFVIIAQDVYPEVLFASGLTDPRSFIGLALACLFAWAYRRATRVVVLGECMRQRLLDKGVNPGRIVTISNWATGVLRREHGADNPLRQQWELGGRFVVLYSGNMGVGHEFATFLKGVQQAAALHPQLAVVFIGDGSRLGEVRTLVQSLRIESRVRFRDFVAADALPLSMGVADLALVTLREGFEGVLVPSKVFGYMARGVPTLYVGPRGDVSQVIEQAGCGACCLNGEVEAVARILCRAMESPAVLAQWSENALASYQQHFTRERALARYVELAQSLLASGASPGA